MAILWPATLPTKPLQEGYSEQMPDMRLKSSMDKGPGKLRRKSAALPWPMDVRMLLSGEQVEYLTTFVDDTLQGGTLRFSFTHPRTGAEVEVRFNEMPKITPSGMKWLADFKLEVLP